MATCAGAVGGRQTCTPKFRRAKVCAEPWRVLCLDFWLWLRQCERTVLTPRRGSGAWSNSCRRGVSPGGVSSRRKRRLSQQPGRRPPWRDGPGHDARPRRRVRVRGRLDTLRAHQPGGRIGKPDPGSGGPEDRPCRGAAEGRHLFQHRNREAVKSGRHRGGKATRARPNDDHICRSAHAALLILGGASVGNGLTSNTSVS